MLGNGGCYITTHVLTSLGLQMCFATMWKCSSVNTTGSRQFVTDGGAHYSRT